MTYGVEFLPTPAVARSGWAELCDATDDGGLAASGGPGVRTLRAVRTAA